jgi:hypothetical protein
MRPARPAPPDLKPEKSRFRKKLSPCEERIRDHQDKGGEDGDLEEHSRCCRVLLVIVISSSRGLTVGGNHADGLEFLLPHHLKTVVLRLMNQAVCSI